MVVLVAQEPSLCFPGVPSLRVKKYWLDDGIKVCIRWFFYHSLIDESPDDDHEQVDQVEAEKTDGVKKEYFTPEDNVNLDFRVSSHADLCDKNNL